MHFKIEFDQQNMAQNKGNFLLSSVPLRGMNFDFFFKILTNIVLPSFFGKLSMIFLVVPS